MSSSENVPNILLLHIQNFKEIKLPTGILKLRLYDLFARFGNIKNIIIFYRKILIKSFIEFETKESAVLAEETCHTTYFETLGQVHLYFLTIQQINKLNNRLSECNLTKPDPNKFQFNGLKIMNQPDDKFGSINNSYKNNGEDSLLDFTPDNVKLNKSMNSGNENNINLNNSFTNCNQIFNNTPCFSSQIQSVPSTNAQRVVLVSNLDDIWMNIYYLFNLFSCFGNIAKILLLTSGKKALIEFKKQVDIKNLLITVNRDLFDDLKIKLCISKYRRLSLSKEQNCQTDNPNKVYIVPKHKHRFPIDSPLFWKPSKIISIKSKQEVETKDYDRRIYNMVYDIKIPISVIIEKEAKSRGPTKISVRFKFEKISSAVRVLSIMHFKNIDGVVFDTSFEAEHE